MRKKHLVVISLLIIFAIGVPFTLFIFNQQQELRSRAEKSTTVYFSPSSSVDNPIQTQVGNTLPLDIMINPGTNLVSLMKLEILYDPAKLEITNATAFQANMITISKIVEGPLITPGKMAVTLSIGTDLNKVINKITRVATLKLKALNSTAETKSTTSVTYGINTQILAIGANASASENVLSSTQPAIISIYSITKPTATPTPKPTATPTPKPTATPTPTPINTMLILNTLLDGIGSRGDNSNPEGSLSNKKPLHPTRSVKINIFDASNKLVSDVSGTINYSSASGSFTGSISSTISSGNYTIKVTTDNHLTRLLPGIQNIKSGQSNKLPDAIFITGDAVIDNKLDIRDYNILLGCYSDLKAATNCKDDTTKNSADFNDDGAVNQFDYNLFLRELATQPGQ